MRKLVVAGILALLVLPGLAARAAPAPEPGFVDPSLASGACAPEAANHHERSLYDGEGWKGHELVRYPGACRRLRFVLGPILVKPGQNDVMAQPLLVEKPGYDGYLVRFDPDLVRADGTVPPIEQVHLHHATWLSEPSYSVGGPFMAAGEEKTIFSFPRGYGLPVSGADLWYVEYMIHSAIATPMEVYLTYEVDYIPKVDAEALGLRAAYPLWLDVGRIGPRPFYPVFNAQRGFGTDGQCTWPRQQCARFDPFGTTAMAGQGQGGNGTGVDFRFPAAGGRFGRVAELTGGTLIWIGGHLHPGGLSNDIDLVRGERSQRIYTGEAVYWSRSNPKQGGGPPTSWDFSMTVQSLPRWGVRVQPGDILRSNATYDTTQQSVYEAMGIAVALFAPDLDGRSTALGIDPFGAPVDAADGCPSGGLPEGVLCDKGLVTHGHLTEAESYGGAEGGLERRTGSPTDRIGIAGFAYVPGDLTTISMTGVPTVPLNGSLAFVNADFALGGILHTVTSCAYPCTGQTGTAFPLADGRSNLGRDLDFDSSELGYGLPLGPARNSVDWTLPVTPANGFERGGTYTYFCRVHPSMRGAFEVT